MTKFRSSLLFALITLLIAVFLGLGILLSQLFKNYYIHTFNERLQKETKFVSIYIRENGGINSIIKKGKVDKLTELLDSNITIVTENGKILYDYPAQSKGNLKRHKKIIENIVHSNSSNNGENEGYEVINGRYDLHYYWKKLNFQGKTEGYVILSNQLNSIKKATHEMWFILSFSLGTALIIILILGATITSRYTRPIEAATRTAIELAKGNYRARTYEEHSEETGKLSNAINKLARNLQELEKIREMQQDRLGTLVENMESGVLLIDNRGYITLINLAYKNLFNVEPLSYLYRVYYDVIQHKEVIRMIEKIFMTEQSIKKQLILPLNLERKHFEVYGAPIIGNNDEWKGILLVFHDITELKRLEQIRKDFVANVSHELKTPITSIKGFTETLLDGAMEDEKTLHNFLSIILKESDRLQTLVQELLELSKIEQQGFSLTIQSFDLCVLMMETTNMFEHRAEEKHISLYTSKPSHPVYIEGDLYRIKQILINLIGNALNYTSEGGEVFVTLEEEQSTVKMIVRDTGIGISKEELPRIFERFYRVDKARSRNSGGTGLGLAIVKHLVEAHKGILKVESEPEKGTVFTVTLHKRIPEIK